MKEHIQDFHCLHCGTPVPPTAADPRFCCAGCAYVHELLCSTGFDRFYDLRGSQTLAPVSPHAMRERDYGWLEELARQAETKAGCDATPSLRLAVQGLSCIGCIWLIERVFQSAPGALRVEIHATRGELHLTWQPGVFDISAFARQLQQFGYLVGKPDEHSAASVQSSSFNRRVGLCGAFALNAMAFCLPSYLGMGADFMFASWFDLIAACSATLSLLVGGTWFAERSWHALRHGVLHIDTPITLGIFAAWTGSMAGWLGGVAALKYFDFVSVFIFLMLGGRWMQQAAVERNRRRLLQSSAVPETIECEDASGRVKPVTLSAIARGHVLSVPAGQVCPVDSVLRSSHASLSLEWINGESEAAHRTEGQAVPSGALNIGTQPLKVEARETWDNALLHRLTAGRDSGAEAAPFFAGLLRGYLAVVVAIGLVAFVWLLVTGHGWAHALQVMISIFVVSCPCALGVAAPFADDLAASWMERLGVFVRSHGLWPKLAHVRKIVFDKTGTLTLENPVLRNPDAVAALDRESRRALHHLVSSNLHPVSRSLFDALGPVPKDALPEVEEVIGQGVWFQDAAGRQWALGRPGWRCAAGREAGEGGDVELSRDGSLLASFSFTDSLRPETLSAFGTLRHRGYAIHLLSGDRTGKVAQTAGLLGIERGCWQAEMTPQQKAQRVRELDARDTLFVGDGANDSLALEAAFCGGSPVTGRNFLEHKADFYFLGSSLRFMTTLLAVARLRQRAVRRIFTFALTYNVGAVALCLTGHMSPLLAAVLMPLSSIVTLAIARATFGRLSAVAGAGGSPQEAPPTAQSMIGSSAPAPV